MNSLTNKQTSFLWINIINTSIPFGCFEFPTAFKMRA